MKILARFIAIILASLVFSVASGYILSRTLLHADYVMPRAKEAKVFDAAAQLLPTLAVPQEVRGTKQGAQLHARLSELFTPAYVETKLTTYAQQLEAHYRDGAPAPSLDLASLAADAKAAGLDIDPADVQPIQISSETDQHIQQSVNLVKGAHATVIIVAAVLGVILLLISIKIHDYSGIINVLALNAFLFVVLCVILKVAPGPLASLIPIPTEMADIKPLTDALSAAVVRVAQDISGHYLVGAIVSGVLLMAMYAIATISRLRHKPVTEKSAKAS